MIENFKSDKELNIAINIFTDAFVNDTLFLFSFPDEKQRRILTRIMYEFVIYDIVPLMNLKLKGLFIKNKLVSVCTYTTPESKTVWTNKLEKAVNNMREKADDKSISLIGEYSMKSRIHKIEKPHFYFNELAVSPAEQGKGYGKKMFEYIEAQCLKHPTAQGIYLDTPNPKNVKIYKHLGYKVVSKFKFYELTGYIMYKDIK
ncbi:MAG: GNAT family N-acetyltransferase [Ignavibacteria bacterium]|jgi:GNAT superfamily N-acetyltransferase